MAELRRRLQDQQGFSLVELLVVIVLAGIIGGAVLTAVVSAGRAERVALDLRENTDSARLATERLRDEIRTAWGACNDSTSSSVTIWWRDDDDDRKIDPEELGTYDIVDGQLRRTVDGSAPQVLATGLGTDSEFTFIDRSGNEVLTPLADRALDCSSLDVVEGRGDVASIGVILTGDSAADDRVVPTRVEMQIAMRNAAVADGTINPNRPPIASFTQSCTGLQCFFDASDSHDEDGTIETYQWAFGDGTAATGEQVTKTFLTAQSWPVVLTVIDDGGATDSITQFVDLGDGQAVPSAAFTVNCSDMECVFDPSATTHAAGTIASYLWEFGDGETASTATAEIVPHTYAVPGAYPVTLTVFDTEGAFGTQNQTANPTTDASGIVIELFDESTWRSSNNTNNWNAKVGIRATFLDGAPVVGVEIAGRFGPDTSDLGSLESRSTNSLGEVSLQASGHLNKSVATYVFQVESAGTHTIAGSSDTTIVLYRPS